MTKYDNSPTPMQSLNNIQIVLNKLSDASLLANNYFNNT